MATVNMDSILAKVTAYSNTKAGKTKMRQAIRDMRQNNIGETGCGSKILTIDKMEDLADELISVIRRTAYSYDLAPSVMRHFDSLQHNGAEAEKDGFTCRIYFRDNLGRWSLDDGVNAQERLYNIVALFNNGYVASTPKYGWWEGHAGTGECAYRSGSGTGAAFVKGVQGRPSLHFMQQAIWSFTAEHREYPLEVVLSDDYDGNYAGSLNGFITRK